MLLEPHVTVSFSKPFSGWLGFTINADGQEHRISCSHVYCPFEDLVRFMDQLSKGLPAAIEIDEEGPATIIRVDQEPGFFTGRLRVYQPGVNGAVETMHIDSGLWVTQFLSALLDALVKLAAEHDPRHWNEDGAADLRKLDLRMVEATVRELLALPPLDGAAA